MFPAFFVEKAFLNPSAVSLPFSSRRSFSTQSEAAKLNTPHLGDDKSSTDLARDRFVDKSERPGRRFSGHFSVIRLGAPPLTRGLGFILGVLRIGRTHFVKLEGLKEYS
jgi:hypothetical protein